MHLRRLIKTHCVRAGSEMYACWTVSQHSRVAAATSSRVSSAGCSVVTSVGHVAAPSTRNGAAFIRHSFPIELVRRGPQLCLGNSLGRHVGPRLSVRRAKCSAQWADNHNNCARGKLQPCCRTVRACVLSLVRRKQKTRKGTERSREREKSRRSDGKTARNLATLILLRALPERAHFRLLALYGRHLFLFRSAVVVDEARGRCWFSGWLESCRFRLCRQPRCAAPFFWALPRFALLSWRHVHGHRPSVALWALNAIYVNSERRQDLRMSRFVPVSLSFFLLLICVRVQI